MNTEPNLSRLTHLKLDGYPPLATVVFCPSCDFQYPPERFAYRACPDCGATMHSTRVTPDLVELVRAAA